MLNIQQQTYFLPKAYNAALRAGKAILDIYERHDRSFDLKSDRTPITLADRLAHNIIKEYLGQTRIPLLSEEGREMLYEERKGWDLFWMVDPLDGTKEFLKGNGEFTVNIALMVNNRPVLGLIYVPYKSTMFFSIEGVGAFRQSGVEADAEAELPFDRIMQQLERLPLRAEKNVPLRIAVSRSHNTKETFDHIEAMRKDYPDAAIVEQGSSYKFCLLAEGTVDYYIRTTFTYEWDTAAGEIILAEAGGCTRSYPDDSTLAYNKESLLNPHFICRSKGFR